jgi:hypothetical protein
MTIFNGNKKKTQLSKRKAKSLKKTKMDIKKWKKIVCINHSKSSLSMYLNMLGSNIRTITRRKFMKDMIWSCF